MKNTLSLVIFDTDAYRLAKHAVDRTVELFPFDDVLIFSDDPSQWGSHPVIQMKKIETIMDYNQFMLLDLPNYLKTDFALTIQYDGFVINPDSFTDFFYKFDYIGAAWQTKNGGAQIGNGGFSLRSKRLIDCIANKYHGMVNVMIPEDRTVCRFLRPLLEDFDSICYAPVEVARHFSIESETPRNHIPFGFHGLHLLPFAYQYDLEFLLNNLPRRCLTDPDYLERIRYGFSFMNADAQKLLSQRIDALK